MLKKLFIASALLAVSTQLAFATSGAPYVGASVGQKTNTATYVNFRGVPVDIFVGYGAIIGEGLYIGGEVLANVTTAEVTDNGLKSTYGYAASFLPGLLISDHTMAYLRLGILRQHFSPSGLKANTVSAGQLGIGLQTNLMQNWDLRGEYDYDAYGSLSGIAGNPRGDEFDMALLYKFD
jgi:opacity protein-like surface antigen